MTLPIHVHSDGTADDDPRCEPVRLRVVDPPAVRQHVAPVCVTSWTELQEWLDAELEKIESKLGDEETAQSLGHDRYTRLTERRTLLLDVAFRIAIPVGAERVEQQRAVEEDRADLYDPSEGESHDPDPDAVMAQWQAEDR